MTHPLAVDLAKIRSRLADSELIGYRIANQHDDVDQSSPRRVKVGWVKVGKPMSCVSAD
jgi:hypothetical protein